jgi:hypothetical protein
MDPNPVDEDEVGRQWTDAIARWWFADLADSRQDLYALDDGQPVTAVVRASEPDSDANFSD